MEEEWSCYRGCQFHGGEWFCYKGGLFNGGGMVMEVGSFMGEEWVILQRWPV